MRFTTIVVPWAAASIYALSLTYPDKIPTEYAVNGMLGALLFICIVGTILELRKKKPEYDGTLQIDESGEEKDIYRMVFDVDPGDFKERKSVTFKVEKTYLE